MHPEFLELELWNERLHIPWFFFRKGIWFTKSYLPLCCKMTIFQPADRVGLIKAVFSSVISSIIINKFIQKCQHYYNLSDQSVPLVTVTSVEIIILFIFFSKITDWLSLKPRKVHTNCLWHWQNKIDWVCFKLANVHQKNGAATNFGCHFK